MEPAAGHIMIVGPGALGTALACRMGRTVRALWLLDHRAERARALAESGLRLTDGGAWDWTPPPGRVGADLGKWPAMDVVFFCVKGRDLAGALRRTRPVIRPKTACVFFQDGLDLEKSLRGLPPRQRLWAFSPTRFALEAPGRALRLLSPDGVSGKIALDAASPAARPVADLLNRAGVDTAPGKGVMEARRRRALALACLELPTALADAPLRRAVEPPLSRVVDALIEEVLRVAAAEKRPVPRADLHSDVLALAAAGGETRPSFWRDLAKGRGTERAFFLDPLLTSARRRRAAVPVLSLMGALLAGAEKTRRPK